MAKVPAPFKRFSAAFDELEARARLSESSGSEHSAAAAEESSGNLSELVESFLERDCGVQGESCGDGEGEKERNHNESESNVAELETKQMMLSLIGSEEVEVEDRGVRRMICVEMELAWRSFGSGSSEDIKRRGISWLRLKGFNAGLCKSRWEKTANSPAGEHEYIDIILSGTRYIIDTSPTSQFTIARPTDHYASLLQLFPPVLVCKEDELKAVVRLMCSAMRQSLKKSEMHVPPWRRNTYMQAKWFGPYKRTTNLVPAKKVADRVGRGFTGKSLVGFETLQGTAPRCVCCNGEVVRKDGFCLRVA